MIVIVGNNWEQVRNVFSQYLYLLCDTIVSTATGSVKVMLIRDNLWYTLIINVGKCLGWSCFLYRVVKTLSCPLFWGKNKNVGRGLNLLSPLSAIKLALKHQLILLLKAFRPTSIMSTDALLIREREMSRRLIIRLTFRDLHSLLYPNLLLLIILFLSLFKRCDYVLTKIAVKDLVEFARPLRWLFIFVNLLWIMWFYWLVLLGDHLVRSDAGSVGGGGRGSGVIGWDGVRHQVLVVELKRLLVGWVVGLKQVASWGVQGFTLLQVLTDTTYTWHVQYVRLAAVLIPTALLILLYLSMILHVTVAQLRTKAVLAYLLMILLLLILKWLSGDRYETLGGVLIQFHTAKFVLWVLLHRIICSQVIGLWLWLGVDVFFVRLLLLVRCSRECARKFSCVR